MSIHTMAVTQEIVEERTRQDAKWGEQNHPNGTGDDRHLLRDISRPTYGTICYLAKNTTDHNAAIGNVSFADILVEEVFEALAEADPLRLRTELIQVAAVAAQWVEAIDRKANDHPALADPEGLALVQAIHDRKKKTPGHPTATGAGYDCSCGECLYARRQSTSVDEEP